MPPLPKLILGCGYLGLRVATAWKTQGFQVCALTRNRGAFLAEHGIDAYLGDVLQPDTFPHLPVADTILYSIGLDRSTNASMRDVYVDGLTNALTILPASQKFVYISSTSVYGQTNGSWVDESSDTTPRERAGQVMVDAEAVVRKLRPKAIILRFAGIYGPNRLLRRNPILNHQPLVGDADKALNLIHVDDGVQAVLAAEKHGIPGTTYNIADDTPVTRRDFYTFLAELLGAAPALFEPSPSGQQQEPNRRISNQKARTELQFTPQYSSYREGLVHAVAASKPILQSGE